MFSYVNDNKKEQGEWKGPKDKNVVCCSNYITFNIYTKAKFTKQSIYTFV